MNAFYSKKGFWLSLILWIPFSFTIVVAIYENELSAIIGLSSVMLFIAWLWFGTKYIIKKMLYLLNVGLLNIQRYLYKKSKKLHIAEVLYQLPHAP